MRTVLALVLSLCAIGTAEAAQNPTAAVLAKLAQRDTATYAYFAGLGQGISYANASLGGDRHRMLYCPPKDVALGSRDYETILRDFVHEHPSEADAEVSLMLIFGLQNKYPCEP